ncbi:MAG: 3-deoxy-7-phosphoheptulonate synthase [Acidobacteriota bacterium]
MQDRKGYRIVSRDSFPEYSSPDKTLIVKVGGAAFGGPRPVVIAGPCAVESEEQTLEIAHVVRQCGGDMLRGGAFKPRTSPYSFQGLGKEGLRILHLAGRETGLPVVTEVLDVRLLDLVAEYADMIQVGSRSMQNFPLLTEVGRSGKPVLLKRAMAVSLQEWLCAAEYIAKEGNVQIVLCERGVRSHAAGEYSRFTLDLNVIRPAQRATYLPVVVDPSHATGDPEMVPLAARAALASGAHGLIIEVIGASTRRSEILCDGEQGIRPAALRELIETIGRPEREPLLKTGARG